MNKSGIQGVSLIEVLLLVMILGILSGMGYPIVVHLVEEGRVQAAKSTALSINAAKQSFKMKHFRAEQEYSSQATDEGKYALLKAYLPSSNISLETLLPKGYRIGMNASIRDRVGLFGPKGEIHY